MIDARWEERFEVTDAERDRWLEAWQARLVERFAAVEHRLITAFERECR